MALARRLARARRWGPIAALAAVLTFFTIAFLLLHELTAPIGAKPSAAARSYQAADARLPSDQAAPSQGPDGARADQVAASELPGPGSAPQPGAPPDPENASPSAGEQRVFRSRRALETIDPRELLRQTHVRN